MSNGLFYLLKRAERSDIHNSSIVNHHSSFHEVSYEGWLSSIDIARNLPINGLLCYTGFNRIDCDFLLTIPNPAEPKLKIDGFLKSPQRANSKILLLVISIGYEIKV